MKIKAVSILLMLVSRNFCQKNEKLLIRTVLKDYVQSARPVLNVSKLKTVAYILNTNQDNQFLLTFETFFCLIFCRQVQQ